ncbi:MAG: DNA/RNA nuclease SfsA [Firmicutes bacterium]|nr:DNA/RNA nuclease SfsA [Bacillota bacterium]
MIIIPNLFYSRLEPAVFRRRLHRFAAEVETGEGREVVHIPNSGRLRELLFPGNQVGLHLEGHQGRKTKYTLVSANTEGGWAFIDARLPNRILSRFWRELPPLRLYEQAYPEKTWGKSRFDLALQSGGPSRTDEPLVSGGTLTTAWLEAKCVTLVQEGTGLFPDAPTERGRKHLQELIRLTKGGGKAFVFFFLQHPEGDRVQANGETDPEFAAVMTEAAKSGVSFYAYRVEPEDEKVTLTEVPVLTGD